MAIAAIAVWRLDMVFGCQLVGFWDVGEREPGLVEIVTTTMERVEDSKPQDSGQR